MKTTRKYYFKLLVFTLIFLVIQHIFQFALVWRPIALGAAAVFLVFAIIPHPGRPIHWLWEKYLSVTTQGVRFFQGFGIFLMVVAFYRLFYVHLNGSVAALQNLDWQTFQSDDQLYWAIGGAVCLFIGVIPPLASIVFAGWMKFAHFMQIIVTQILLTIIYIIAVLPMGLLAKLVGKRFLEVGYLPDAPTYWTDREVEDPDDRHYRRHF